MLCFDAKTQRRKEIFWRRCLIGLEVTKIVFERSSIGRNRHLRASKGYNDLYVSVKALAGLGAGSTQLASQEPSPKYFFAPLRLCVEKGIKWFIGNRVLSLFFPC